MFSRLGRLGEKKKAWLIFKAAQQITWQGAASPLQIMQTEGGTTLDAFLTCEMLSFSQSPSSYSV